MAGTQIWSMLADVYNFATTSILYPCNSPVCNNSACSGSFESFASYCPPIMLRYEKVEQQKQGLKKAAELERRFAKKDGAAAPDGAAAADGAAASSDSDSDQDDEDKITETEEAGKQADSCTTFVALVAVPLRSHTAACGVLHRVCQHCSGLSSSHS